ncbi:MAG: carbonic anhydrase [Bdellovibrionales bacterium]
MNSKNILSLFLMTMLTACATKPKTADAPLVDPNVPAATAPAAAATEHIAIAAETPAEKNAVLSDKSNKKHVVESPSAPAETKAEPAKATHKKDKSVDPKQALLWLEHGNNRFVKGHIRKDGQSRKDIARLASFQHPHAIVLSCSDSRVPPELVFDQKLGEIFVVRTAGEALDPNAIASIEYGLANLGAKLIVVMGHTYCGAINAAIQTIGGGDAGSLALNHLVADIQPRIRASLAKGQPTEDAARESWANAQGIAEDLKRLSPMIRDAVEHEGVVIQPALYYLNSGEVKFQ